MDSSKIKWAFAFVGQARSGKSYAAEVLRSYFSVLDSSEKTEVIAFADVLKRICGVLLGWSAEKALSDESKGLPVHKIVLTEGIFKEIASILCDRPYTPSEHVEEFSMNMVTIATRMEDAVAAITSCPDPKNPAIRTLAEGTTYGRMLQLMGTEGMRTHISSDVFPKHVLAKAIRHGVTVLICPDARFAEEINMIRSIHGFVARIVPGAGYTGLSDGRSTTHASENSLDESTIPRIVNDFNPDFSHSVRAWAISSIAEDSDANE